MRQSQLYKDILADFLFLSRIKTSYRITMTNNYKRNYCQFAYLCIRIRRNVYIF